MDINDARELSLLLGRIKDDLEIINDLWSRLEENEDFFDMVKQGSVNVIEYKDTDLLVIEYPEFIACEDRKGIYEMLRRVGKCVVLEGGLTLTGVLKKIENVSNNCIKFDTLVSRV